MIAAAAAASTTPAWIAAGAAVLAAGVSGAFLVRQSTKNGELQADLARLNAKLEAELEERKASAQRERDAEEVLKRYREPLAAAAFDLQSRLYNILRMDFFARFGGDHERCRLAEKTTLFRIAQYFGWSEILRRDIQFLSFPSAGETQAIIELLWRISRRFGSSEDHRGLMIWTDEQRAIGERMIVEEHGVVLCMGYARFEEEYERCLRPWCEHLRPALHGEAGHERLTEVQHLLCDLVRALDPERIRYNNDLDPA
jgi:hypothetical protein